jgi:hypothetical protein
MRRLLLPAAICILLPLSATAAPRDWKESPAIVRLGTQADIFAMGDVHGDYQRLVALLAGESCLMQDEPGARVCFSYKMSLKG